MAVAVVTTKFLALLESSRKLIISERFGHSGGVMTQLLDPEYNDAHSEIIVSQPTAG